jgi:hypothetical protein
VTAMMHGFVCLFFSFANHFFLSIERSQGDSCDPGYQHKYNQQSFHKKNLDLKGTLFQITSEIKMLNGIKP